MFKKKRSTVFYLIVFIFLLLFIVATLIGEISKILTELGINIKDYYIGYFYLLMATLVLAMILTVVFGQFIIRPYHKLIIATCEIASGNFKIRIEENSSLG